MTQNDLVVVGIDVARDKVDSPAFAGSNLRADFPQTVPGRCRKLIAWLGKHGVWVKLVMEGKWWLRA